MHRQPNRPSAMPQAALRPVGRPESDSAQQR